MARITRVYTRTGDDGTTGLGSNQRVPKYALRIEAYGAVDELNAHIGTVMAAGPTAELLEPLRRIQNELFHLGADLSIPEVDKAQHPSPRLGPQHVAALEELLNRFNHDLPPLQNFVLPGGTTVAAFLHVARTVCRRVERIVVALAAQEPVGPDNVPYLNRLSDLLFVMARFHNQKAGVTDPTWNSRA